MAAGKWNEITRADVLEAIRRFDEKNLEYPEARSTFLIYDGRTYPAKHIRGMAYQVHFGHEISKADFAGGLETVRFFEKLEFQVRYTHKSAHTPAKHNSKYLQTENTAEQKKPKTSVKIGMYLQADPLCCNTGDFEKAMDLVRKSDIDILVFPEFSYVPFEAEYRMADVLNGSDLQRLYDSALAFSQSIGKAVVVCNKDRFGTIMSIYANAFASEEETICKDYIKHTMTDFSACDIENYQELAEYFFTPIIYKDVRIGLTICYDCNHAIFSRKYGLNGVDIILNSTGGDVIYQKWFKYNKVRAIENQCFTFVTMGYDTPNNYVYGFTPAGQEMTPVLLNGTDTEKHNVLGGIYVYDTADDDGSSEIDSSLNQAETVNLHSDLAISAGDITGLLAKGTPLTDSIRIVRCKDMNIVMCFVDDDDIMKPERVLQLLYADVLKDINNKRYLIVNRWTEMDTDFFNSQLSVVLKVKAMENYCAVLLVSDTVTKCYQCGKNRTAQVVKSENGKFGIDLSRTTGPEAIWRNKQGMRADWRKQIEWLIGTM